jgi:hypothetical protein
MRWLSRLNGIEHHLEERTDLVGETLPIVGSRAEESTFPYGFFKDWILDKNTGRFARG